MLSTILFLSREGVRGALLRVNPGHDEKTDKESNGNAVMNVGFIPIIIGVPPAVGTSLLYVATAGAETRVQPHFYLAVRTGR
ncbi:hypothetical protein BDP27DRAFT_689673 [Rhodocollybia butyracea]|uniref:Man(5)GlcNAc(2)-PP-dolichol translocation protein RFT1 n=1 Tax=Rhodocollybia butyracea TaxID=206335 RepID=A0A9P5P2T3_9AGAR|nr:hypothetical protein BDP27DRAFT_689673 [Rhodocollybia butyracea]